MNDDCDVTFYVGDLPAAIDWYRSAYCADVVYSGRGLALLQLGGVTLALILREALWRTRSYCGAPLVAFGETADQGNDVFRAAVV